MLDVAVALADPWPLAEQARWEEIGAQAVAAALLATPHRALADGAAMVEVSIRLTSDAQVQGLNAQWRGKDKPTNVLSFPQMDAALIVAMASDAGDGADEESAEDNWADDAGEILLGDIILAAETCIREAGEKGISIEAHATHLVVHGMLHLLGYDHIDDGEAVAMEDLERSIMASLGHADPYAADGVE
ncbi:MAG: rRNA maturation RNase YbeY [Sphingopyxis sp.]